MFQITKIENNNLEIFTKIEQVKNFSLKEINWGKGLTCNALAEINLDQLIYKACVSIDKCDITNIKSCDDLEEFEKKKIVHFFERYKDLERGKWVKVDCWGKMP